MIPSSRPKSLSKFYKTLPRLPDHFKDEVILGQIRNVSEQENLPTINNRYRYSRNVSLSRNSTKSDDLKSQLSRSSSRSKINVASKIKRAHKTSLNIDIAGQKLNVEPKKSKNFLKPSAHIKKWYYPKYESINVNLNVNINLDHQNMTNSNVNANDNSAKSNWRNLPKIDMTGSDDFSLKGYRSISRRAKTYSEK